MGTPAFLYLFFGLVAATVLVLLLQRRARLGIFLSAAASVVASVRVASGWPASGVATGASPGSPCQN